MQEQPAVLVDNIIVYMNMLANWLQVACLIWLVYAMFQIQRNQKAEIMIERLASAAESLEKIHRINAIVDAAATDGQGKISQG
jgi:hypothetical protein